MENCTTGTSIVLELGVSYSIIIWLNAKSGVKDKLLILVFGGVGAVVPL